MKKRILMLYTGGTIGMTRSEHGYAPTQGFTACLAERLQRHSADNLPHYHLHEFDTLIDSANSCPRDWADIATALAIRWDQYDGFVVLHGTDTMAYTASALSFLLNGINKPVIVTGSQIPLSEAHTDALENVTTSLIFATNHQITDVCICFNGRLLRGNRSSKVHSTALQAFDSPNFPWLGKGKGQTQEKAEIHTPQSLRNDLLQASGSPSFNIPVFHPNAIVIAHLYPGIPVRVIDALLDSSDVKALIIQSYGVGNPPDNNQDLMASFQQASERGVVILNISQCLSGGVQQGTYATGATLNNIGVVSGEDLTLEAAFAKLHYLIAIGLSAAEIRQQISVAMCGECGLHSSE